MGDWSGILGIHLSEKGRSSFTGLVRDEIGGKMNRNGMCIDTRI
jgi:hypothetical protein